MEDACDTGLVLGLGKYHPSLKSSRPSSLVPKLIEPTPLTLGLSDDAYNLTSAQHQHQQLSSPPSTNSSISSIKHENIDIGNEEMERVSSRTTDEEEEGGIRKKLRLTKDQSALLEDKFKEHTTLNPKQKQALAKQLNLRPRQVEVWFQNRRARTKLKQTEVDCEVLKRCCETLSDENRRLQKELQELKALKVAPAAPPVYMPILAPQIVTVCPSCKKVITGAIDEAKARPFIVAPKPQFFNPNF